jgi:HlyD family secretion protein
MTSFPNYIKSKTQYFPVFAIILLIFLYWISSESPQEKEQFIIKSTSFSNHVLARGEVQPAKVIPIKSSVSDLKSKLVWIAEDGKSVKRNEVIARFDQSPFEEKLQAEEQYLADAKAQFEMLNQQLAILNEEEQKKVEKAKKELEIAKLKVSDMLHGQGPMTRELHQVELAQIKRELSIAEAEVTDFKLMLDKGHVSRREFEKVADKVKQLQESASLKQKQLDNFDKYEWPKIKRQAEVTEEQAYAEYLTALKLSDLNVRKMGDRAIKVQRDILRIENKVEKIKQNISACTIRAPIEGQLFHTELPRADGVRKIQVGDNIFAGQTFMQIPDTNQLTFEVEIREFDLSQVEVGQPANIVLDAFPNQNIDAVVNKISTVASEKSDEQVNQFLATLHIVEPEFQAHVGMYGQATIVVNSVENVLAAPLHFIKKEQDKNWVELVNGRMVEVQLGLVNNHWVELIDGVSENQVIVR